MAKVTVLVTVPESSLTMVAVPWLSPNTPFTGAERFSASVSLGSAAVSPMTWTGTGSAVCPGAKFKVPLAAT